MFVLLVLDEQNKGIPVGYLLFSAAGGAQRASSSYNHSILKELILHYKNKLEQEKNCEFIPKVYKFFIKWIKNKYFKIRVMK